MCYLLSFFSIFVVSNPSCLFIFVYSKKLEEVIGDVNYIMYLKSLPMDSFEPEIWDRFGSKYVPASDRRKVIYLAWTFVSFLIIFFHVSRMLHHLYTYIFSFLFHYRFSSATVFIIWNWIDICSHAEHVFNKNCCMCICSIAIQYFSIRTKALWIWYLIN